MWVQAWRACRTQVAGMRIRNLQSAAKQHAKRQCWQTCMSKQASALHAHACLAWRPGVRIREEYLRTNVRAERTAGQAHYRRVAARYVDDKGVGRSTGTAVKRNGRRARMRPARAER